MRLLVLHQRFGNLTHEQGWIAKSLMLGQHEEALKQLLTSVSPFDRGHDRSFKEALLGSWGDWRACRDIAGKFGSHHSIFEHLKRNPTDFAGAFRYVAASVRLMRDAAAISLPQVKQ